MIKNKFTFKVYIMNPLHQPDGPLEFGFFYAWPLTIWRWKSIWYGGFSNNIIYWNVEFVTIDGTSRWWNAISLRGSDCKFRFLLFFWFLRINWLLFDCFIWRLGLILYLSLVWRLVDLSWIWGYRRLWVCSSLICWDHITFIMYFFWFFLLLLKLNL